MDPSRATSAPELIPRTLREWAKVRHYAAAAGKAHVGGVAAMSSRVINQRGTVPKSCDPCEYSIPRVIARQVNANLEPQAVSEYLNQ